MVPSPRPAKWAPDDYLAQRSSPAELFAIDRHRIRFADDQKAVSADVSAPKLPQPAGIAVGLSNQYREPRWRHRISFPLVSFSERQSGPSFEPWRAGSAAEQTLAGPSPLGSPARKLVGAGRN